MSRVALLTEKRCLQAALVSSGALFMLSAAAAIWQLVWSERITIFGGCGWDGYFYCSMLRGDVVPEPFSRRILVPFLAKRVETDGLAGFWVVDILSLVAATLLAMYVAWRLCSPAGTRQPVAYRVVPSILIGAAFLSARNSFHLVATYPALSDALALLLLVTVVALVVLPLSPSSNLLLIPICFLAPLSREQLSVVLALALVLAASMRLLTWRLSLAGAAAAVAGGLYAFSRPHSGPSQSIRDTLHLWLDQDFGSWEGFLRFSTMVILALGPFVLLLGTIRRKSSTSRSALWLVGTAAIFMAVSAFNGGDTDRILFPAGLLLALAAVISVRSARGLLGLCVIVAAYFVQQEPWHAVSGDPAAWLTFFGLRVTPTGAVFHNAVVPTLIALPIAAAGLMLIRSRKDELTRSIQ